MIEHPSLEFIGRFEAERDAWVAGASAIVRAGGTVFAWKTRQGFPNLTATEVNQLAADFREPERGAG